MPTKNSKRTAWLIVGLLGDATLTDGLSIGTVFLNQFNRKLGAMPTNHIDLLFL
jgi:hypothetical protein